MTNDIWAYFDMSETQWISDMTECMDFLKNNDFPGSVDLISIKNQSEGTYPLSTLIRIQKYLTFKEKSLISKTLETLQKVKSQLLGHFKLIDNL